jgi:hypothetical protein
LFHPIGLGRDGPTGDGVEYGEVRASDASTLNGLIKNLAADPNEGPANLRFTLARRLTHERHEGRFTQQLRCDGAMRLSVTAQRTMLAVGAIGQELQLEPRRIAIVVKHWARGKRGSGAARDDAGNGSATAATSLAAYGQYAVQSHAAVSALKRTCARLAAPQRESQARSNPNDRRNPARSLRAP